MHSCNLNSHIFCGFLWWHFVASLDLSYTLLQEADRQEESLNTEETKKSIQESFQGKVADLEEDVLIDVSLLQFVV